MRELSRSCSDASRATCRTIQSRSAKQVMRHSRARLSPFSDTCHASTVVGVQVATRLGSCRVPVHAQKLATIQYRQARTCTMASTAASRTLRSG